MQRRGYELFPHSSAIKKKKVSLQADRHVWLGQRQTVLTMICLWKVRHRKEGAWPAVGEQEGKSWQDRQGGNVEETRGTGDSQGHAQLLKTLCHTRGRWADRFTGRERERWLKQTGNDGRRDGRTSWRRCLVRLGLKHNIISVLALLKIEKDFAEKC